MVVFTVAKYINIISPINVYYLFVCLRVHLILEINEYFCYVMCRAQAVETGTKHMRKAIIKGGFVAIHHVNLNEYL